MLSSFQNLPSRVKVGNKYIGEGEPTFFIAEIGNNHNGDYFLAKKTIEQAAKVGANAVKLQKRFIDDVFAAELKNRVQTKDQVLGKTYGEYRENLELNKEEFTKLKKFAEGLGLVFFATPFDMKSVDFLEDIGVEIYKIASFDVTNLPLLEYVAKKGKPIIMSTGMSDIDEVDEAVETILQHNNQLIIKHCVTIYPTPYDKINLSSISVLKERYHPLPIGYSGHEKGFLPSLASVALGAKSIERHFTLDKSLPGPDHSTVSIDPKEFSMLIKGVRELEQAVGVPQKKLWDEEVKVREKHGKSIVANVNIPAGTAIKADMIMCKSPGYGIKPRMINKVIGKRAKIDISEDTVIKEEDINWEENI